MDLFICSLGEDETDDYALAYAVQYLTDRRDDGCPCGLM